MPYFTSFDQKQIFFRKQYNCKNRSLAKHQLIFVHGMGGDPSSLEPLISSTLAKLPKSRAISYNLRGHAASSKNFNQKQSFIDHHAQDLFYLCQHLDIQKPILIGHSLGGIIIQEFINARFPIKAQKNVFICSTTSLPRLPISRKLAFKFLTKLNHYKTQAQARPVAFHLQFQNGRDIDLKRAYSDTKVVGAALRWLAMVLSTYGYQNLHPELINQKNTLYIYGKKDLIINKWQQEKNLQTLTKVKKIAIDSNHISHLTNTQTVAQLISNFIQRD